MSKETVADIENRVLTKRIHSLWEELTNMARTVDAGKVNEILQEIQDLESKRSKIIMDSVVTALNRKPRQRSR